MTTPAEIANANTVEDLQRYVEFKLSGELWARWRQIDVLDPRATDAYERRIFEANHSRLQHTVDVETARGLVLEMQTGLEALNAQIEELRRLDAARR
jgi:hypothetical protein